MDQSAGNKKRSPAGTSRRAYSIFGGIINLAQSHASGGGKSNASGSVSVVGSPPGSASNVYTVTVTNSQNPAEASGTNQVRTYENVAAMKKKKSDQSLSTVSSLTNAGGMSSGSSSTGKPSSNNGGRIGPAPRTLSILTALNELAISDEIALNPTCSPGTPSAPTSNNGRSSGNNRSTANLTSPYSACPHPSKRSSSSSGNYVSTNSNIHVNTGQVHENATNVTLASSSASLFPSPSSTAVATTVYHSTITASGGGGLAHFTYNNNHPTAARLKGYPEPHRNVPTAAPATSSTTAAAAALPSQSTSANTLPSKLRAGNKSLGGHKETFTRKGALTRQRDRSKSRTPDWIWKIFQLTKHGKLKELQQSLLGLDPTLIRHLADAKGNTVLHCAARGGHVNTLQWLVSVLGSQCTEAALSDHNQAGRTVMLTALKKGQLECLQWLVHHTKRGEKALVPNEGERSLLHFAATYGDLNVVRWLCTELIDKGIAVDIRDTGGMTPLHSAAKSGNLTVCHELILAGADPLAQTELGWRPSDLAIRHRHMECASYFMVAEAAGSLGNQLHSLLLAFNQLRQEHEELRSHFRETLRVGKWLAKERNDLIKHFPSSKWSQEATSSSLLLGGTNNGARFSDLEHKLVVAEQAWRKLSQNPVDTTTDAFLNGEEAALSNLSSQDFLHQRLVAVQLRHERGQSLGSTLSGSSDEDLHCAENSSSDASSSDVEVDERTATAGSAGPGAHYAGSPVSAASAAAPAIIHSSSVSPEQMEKSTMKTRSKAAPWLLPPNDTFLSQLSPFVGAHVGKSLPTLDLLHGAPTSPTSLLSPIVIPSSPASATSSPVTTTTEAAGKNEKSLVQMDVERHSGGHGGKRDSTSLDVSVLEVIEPASHVSSSTFTKKVEDGMEQFHVSSSRPWLDFSDQTKGILRSLPAKRGNISPSSPHTTLGIGDDSNPGGFVGGGGGGRRSAGPVKTSGAAAVTETCGGSDVTSNSSTLAAFMKHGVEHEIQTVPNIAHHQAPDLLCGTQRRPHLESHGKKSRHLSLRDRQQSEDYHCHSERRDVMEAEVDALYEPISIQARDHEKLLLTDEKARLDGSSVQLHKSGIVLVDTTKGESLGNDQSRPHHRGKKSATSEQQELTVTSGSLVHLPLSTCKRKSGEDNGKSNVSSESENERDKMVAYSTSVGNSGKANFNANNDNNGGGAGGGSSVVSLTCLTVSSNESCTPAAAAALSKCAMNGRSLLSSSSTITSPSMRRTPSPKSYITKLTVIPLETNPHEAHLVPLKSASFTREGEEAEADADELHLPGENQDDLCLGALSCQIPSDSVSSSNTPVMPRFNSSGTVVFPFRSKHDWHSMELLSLTTPDSSLAGRLSPTPSETSRTESTHAPPPSYVSHASQNSEVSKTESARGQASEEADLDAHGAHHLPEEPNGYANDGDHFACIHQSIVVSSEEKLENNGNNSHHTSNNNLEENVDGAEPQPETSTAPESREPYKMRLNKKPDYSSSCNKKVEGAGDDDDHGDNDASNTRTATISGTSIITSTPPATSSTTVKPRSGRIFATRRMHTGSTGFIRSHLSTGIHKAGAQRLPKGHRGQSKPWYEIEGSDDEGSLLRAATKSRSSHSSKYPSSDSSSSSPSSSGNNGEEDEEEEEDGSNSRNEFEDNDHNNNGNNEVEQEQDGGEQQQPTSKKESRPLPPTQQNSGKHNAPNFL